MFKKTWKIAFVLAVAACMFTHGNVVKAQSLEDGLVGYWTFDAADTDGATAKNAKGDNHGTITGATPVAGQIGEALLFNGTSDFVTFAVEPMSEALSIMAWANATTWAPGGRRNIIDSITGGMWYRLGFQSSGGNFEFVCDTGDDVGGREQAVNDMTGLEGWHHIAGVRDFANKVLIMYVDAVEVATFNFQFSTPIVTEALVVGAGHRGTLEYWDGPIDEVAIFNIALTANDIANVMDNGLSAIATSSVSLPGKLTSTWGDIKAQ